MEPNPHAFFIAAAYGLTGLVVAALILRATWEGRRQRRRLAELEGRGVRRRSERTEGAGPSGAALRSSR